MALCAVVIFTRPGNLGFALAGPFVLLPWTLMLISGWSRQRYQFMRWFFALFLPIMLLVALMWPAIVLLG